MTVYVFFEGATEDNVVGKVCQAIAHKRIQACGKGSINTKLRTTLGPLVGPEPIRGLVLRDLDAHDGETLESIVQSLSDTLHRMFEERGVQGVSPNLEPLSEHPNVFVWESAQPDIRVALHIANYRWKQDFIKATIDDYVLALALKPSVAEALVQSQNLVIAPERLIEKVTQEIPTLLDTNGIRLIEAKDYVRLYAAVIKAHTSPSVFAQKTLSHAGDATIKATFAPLLAACEYLNLGKPLGKP